MRLLWGSELRKKARAGPAPRRCAVDEALPCSPGPRGAPGAKPSRAVPACVSGGMGRRPGLEIQVQAETSYLVGRDPTRAPLAFLVLLMPNCPSLKTLPVSRPCGGSWGVGAREAEEPALWELTTQNSGLETMVWAGRAQGQGTASGKKGGPGGWGAGGGGPAGRAQLEKKPGGALERSWVANRGP